MIKDQRKNTRNKGINIFKKTIKILLIIGLSAITGWIILVGIGLFLIGGGSCKIYEFVGRLFDPCLSFDYPSKGPSYDVRDDRVCYTDKKAPLSCPASWGGPSLVITRTLKGADSKTFQTNGNYYGIDKNHVYYWGEIQPIKRENVRYFDNGYVIDDTSVYNDGEKINTVDVATFQPLDSSNFTKDKNHVYWVMQIVPGANPETFTSLDFNVGKDDQHVFEKTSIVPIADPDTIKKFNESCFQDKNHFFEYYSMNIIDEEKCRQ